MSANTTYEKRYTLHRYTFWKSAAILQILSVLSYKYDYLEGPGTGKCGRQMLQKFPGIPVKARRREYLKRYYLFLWKHSTGMNSSIRIIPGITKNSIQMVSALDLTTSGWPLCRLPIVVILTCTEYNFFWNYQFLVCTVTPGVSPSRYCPASLSYALPHL